jgi:hypothetical protein
MSGCASQPVSRSARQIANEFCELVQQQIDTLQPGLTEVELEPYVEKCGQIHELHAELRALAARRTIATEAVLNHRRAPQSCRR